MKVSSLPRFLSPYHNKDVDSQAVRVASFSLYLTMLDKIEPQDYWENEFRFPRLRTCQLINADFFQEDKEGFRSDADEVVADMFCCI